MSNSFMSDAFKSLADNPYNPSSIPAIAMFRMRPPGITDIRIPAAIRPPMLLTYLRH
jgi:hypothetical protein